MKARILFYLAVVAALALVALPQAGMAAANGVVVYVPDDYPTIQQAVDGAAAGDTIIVRDGTYHENVVVDKALTIQSENGTANCVVSAANPDDHAVEVTASLVNITGFTVQNATGVEKAGIYLEAVEQCSISSNDVTNNYGGIWLDSSGSNTLMSNNAHDNVYGIIVDSFSNNNALMNNTASNNGYIGFGAAVSSNNTLTNNAANGNSNYGIYLDGSGNNDLTGNTAEDNAVVGIYLESSSSNTLTGNDAGNNTCSIYLGPSSDNNTLTENNVGDSNVGIWLNDSSSNTLSGNNAGSSTYGIILYLASGNTLTGNSASSNSHFGIYIEDSSGNTFTNNHVSDNSYYGIFLQDSSNNTIYNNYFNNANNVRDDGSNTWNTTKTAGTNIVDGPYLGGNYWSDYEGSDVDHDGLGNTQVPYAEGILHCGDYLPLVLPEEVGGSVGATIEGTTYEASANLLAGASIALELDGEEVATTTSDASGCYSFTVNQTGNYTVSVTKGGFTSQSKWANVTALGQTRTADFKGMDAPYPTAPDGLYVIKCCNAWLCGAHYPPGFALNAVRVSDVTYAWVYPS